LILWPRPGRLCWHRGNSAAHPGVIRKVDPPGFAPVFHAEECQACLGESDAAAAKRDVAAEGLQPAPRPADIAGELAMVGVLEPARGDDMREVQGGEPAGAVAVVEAREYEVGVAAGKRFVSHAVERQPPRIGLDVAGPRLGGQPPHTEPGAAGQHGPIIGEARPFVAGELRQGQVRQKRPHFSAMQSAQIDVYHHADRLPVTPSAAFRAAAADARPVLGAGTKIER
jgi:hypothetical protein